jgi:hypothetical protein
MAVYHLFYFWPPPPPRIEGNGFFLLFINTVAQCGAAWHIVAKRGEKEKRLIERKPW